MNPQFFKFLLTYSFYYFSLDEEYLFYFMAKLFLNIINGSFQRKLQLCMRMLENVAKNVFQIHYFAYYTEQLAKKKKRKLLFIIITPRSYNNRQSSKSSSEALRRKDRLKKNIKFFSHVKKKKPLEIGLRNFSLPQIYFLCLLINFYIDTEFHHFLSFFFRDIIKIQFALP